MPADIPSEPSAVAMSGLRKGQFVPLHYFHPSMCNAAFDRQSISMNESIALQVDGNAVSLIREGGLPQKGIIKDSDLSFKDFELASAGLIAKMKECNDIYSEEVVKDVYTFFHLLITHGYRGRKLGDEALLLYAAHSRQHWHVCFASAGKGGPGLFRLGVINEVKLKDHLHDLEMAHL